MTTINKFNNELPDKMYQINNVMKLEDKYSYFHYLLDKYLSSWIMIHPNDKPFVSIKIFKYDENKMNKSYLDKCEEKMIIEKKEFEKEEKKEEYMEEKRIKENRKEERQKQKIKYKQIKLTKKVVKKQTKIGGIDGHIDTVVEEQPSKVEINERYMSDLDITDLKFNIETHDRTVDSTVEVLNIRQSPIINRKLSMKMPNDTYIMRNENKEIEELLEEIEQMDYVKMRAPTDTEALMNEIKYKKEKNQFDNQDNENDVSYIIKKVREYNDKLLINNNWMSEEIKNLFKEDEFKYFSIIKQGNIENLLNLINDDNFYNINKRMIFLLLFMVIKRLKETNNNDNQIDGKKGGKNTPTYDKKESSKVDKSDDEKEEKESKIVKLTIKVINNEDTSDNDSNEDNIYMFDDNDFFDYD